MTAEPFSVVAVGGNLEDDSRVFMPLPWDHLRAVCDRAAAFDSKDGQVARIDINVQDRELTIILAADGHMFVQPVSFASIAQAETDLFVQAFDFLEHKIAFARDSAAPPTEIGKENE